MLYDSNIFIYCIISADPINQLVPTLKMAGCEPNALAVASGALIVLMTYQNNGYALMSFQKSYRLTLTIAFNVNPASSSMTRYQFIG